MENLEKAIYLACKAFIAHYDGPGPTTMERRPEDSPRTQSAPQRSNGIPICPVHDKAMNFRSGRNGDFYSCSSRENDPNLSNRNGYCKHTEKA